MAQTPKLFATKVTVLAALVQTIVRHPERASETACWPHWAAAYPKCKAATAEVIRRAVEAGRLEGRAGKTQVCALAVHPRFESSGW